MLPLKSVKTSRPGSASVVERGACEHEAASPSHEPTDGHRLSARRFAAALRNHVNRENQEFDPCQLGTSSTWSECSRHAS